MSLSRDSVLLIRVDSGLDMGSGHLMRCLALAQAWQDHGGSVLFVAACELPNAKTRLIEEGLDIVNIQTNPGSAEDAYLTTELARKYNASWVVVDGYHFGGDYQKAIKEAGLNLLFVDDYGHADYYTADVILNQNIHADEKLYRNRAEHTKLLLGTRYVLLRREFLRWQDYKREIPETARKLLITMGGSDPQNATLKVLQALRHIDIDGLEAIVAVGGGNPHYEALKDFASGANLPVRIERDVKDISQLMAWADVAITAGGTTCWELASMGVPFAVIILAENQIAVAEHLGKLNYAVNLGWYYNLSLLNLDKVITKLLLDKKGRSRMFCLCQQLIDGKGTKRLINFLLREEQILNDNENK